MHKMLRLLLSVFIIAIIFSLSLYMLNNGFFRIFGLYSVSDDSTNEEQTGLLVDVFRTNVRGVISAIRLTNATTGQTEGNVEELKLSGIQMTGSWQIDSENNEITLINISDGQYCVKTLLASEANNDFSVLNDC